MSGFRDREREPRGVDSKQDLSRGNKVLLGLRTQRPELGSLPGRCLGGQRGPPVTRLLSLSVRVGPRSSEHSNLQGEFAVSSPFFHWVPSLPVVHTVFTIEPGFLVAEVQNLCSWRSNAEPNGLRSLRPSVIHYRTDSISTRLRPRQDPEPHTPPWSEGPVAD